MYRFASAVLHNKTTFAHTGVVIIICFRKRMQQPIAATLIFIVRDGTGCGSRCSHVEVEREEGPPSPSTWRGEA
jgi:hypothetical protein